MVVHTRDISKLWFNTSVVECWAHERTSWGVAGVDGIRGGGRWRVVVWLGWMERITVLIL